MDLNPQATVEGLNKLLTVDYDFYSGSGLNQTFTDFEMGLISSDEFVTRLSKHAPPGTSDTEIIEIWNRMLLELPRERIEMLLLLKKKYKVFLLSNTNEIHINYINEYLRQTYPDIEFETACFHRVYYSYRMGNRKPNLSIYKDLLEKESILPEETIFIDDNIDNIHAARKIGLSAHHHNPEDDLIQVVGRLLS